MIWFLLIAALIIAIPLVIERNRAEMEDADRGSALGQFAELPDGVTHYAWTGPARPCCRLHPRVDHPQHCLARGRPRVGVDGVPDSHL